MINIIINIINIVILTCLPQWCPLYLEYVQQQEYLQLQTRSHRQCCGVRQKLKTKIKKIKIKKENENENENNNSSNSWDNNDSKDLPGSIMCGGRSRTEMKIRFCG